MILQIESKKTISEIKEEFHAVFPFLKLEFFTKPHDVSDASLIREMIKTNPELGELSKNKKSGKIDFTPYTTVAALETAFREHGLNVQVFRKSGTVWLETTITDNLTLQSQNALGKEKSLAPEQPDLSDIDYD